MVLGEAQVGRSEAPGCTATQGQEKEPRACIPEPRPPDTHWASAWPCCGHKKQQNKGQLLSPGWEDAAAVQARGSGHVGFWAQSQSEFYKLLLWKKMFIKQF